MLIDHSLPSKILIIDDEPIVRETLQALLMDVNYKFLLASNGAEGIKLAQECRPDVILLDVMMHDMDGFEVCQYLKLNNDTRHIPIILVTALDNPEDLSRGLDLGADEFISKPPDWRELKARVRSMLRIKHQYDELENMMKLREELSNLIVHDMRSPLNIIIGHGEMLVHTPSLSESVVHRINIINEQSEKLNKFIDEMLIVAQMEQNRLHLNYTEVNLNHLVQQVHADHHVIAAAKNIELLTEIPPFICQLQADEHLIARVLDNLVSNAIKFSPAHTCIAVKLTMIERDRSQQQLPGQNAEQFTGPGRGNNQG